MATATATDKLAYCEFYTSDARAALAEMTLKERHVYVSLLLYGWDNRGWIPNDMARLLIICNCPDELGEYMPRAILEPVITRILAWKYVPHPDDQARWSAVAVAGATVVSQPQGGPARLVNPRQWDSWCDAQVRRSKKAQAAERAREAAAKRWHKGHPAPHIDAKANPSDPKGSPAGADQPSIKQCGPPCAPDANPDAHPMPTQMPAQCQPSCAGNANPDAPAYAHASGAHQPRAGQLVRIGAPIAQRRPVSLPSLPTIDVSPAGGPKSALESALGNANPDANAYATASGLALHSSASASATTIPSISNAQNPPLTPPSTAGGGFPLRDALSEGRPSRRRRYRKTAMELAEEVAAEYRAEMAAKAKEGAA